MVHYLSCYRRCGEVLFDEEIMAGWSPEDSNLNTRCLFCEAPTVPSLTITVLDFRYGTVGIGYSYARLPTALALKYLFQILIETKPNSGSAVALIKPYSWIGTVPVR